MQLNMERPLITPPCSPKGPIIGGDARKGCCNIGWMALQVRLLWTGFLVRTHTVLKHGDAADVGRRAALGEKCNFLEDCGVVCTSGRERVSQIKIRADYRAGLLIQQLPHIKPDVSTKIPGKETFG
jgi:hypothetical protein